MQKGKLETAPKKPRPSGWVVWERAATDCLGRAGVSRIWSTVDLGVTFFDTAEIYGPFTNERLRQALAGLRPAGITTARVPDRIRRKAERGPE
jgi:diketogulonate reductase-like aldo/keto reductase